MGHHAVTLTGASLIKKIGAFHIFAGKCRTNSLSVGIAPTGVIAGETKTRDTSKNDLIFIL